MEPDGRAKDGRAKETEERRAQHGSWSLRQVNEAYKGVLNSCFVYI